MSRIRPVTARSAPKMVNIQSTLLTAPDLYNHVSFVELLGSNGNSYTVYTHTLMLHNVETLVRPNKKKNK